MAVRSALHRAGAAALAELLQFPAPTAERRTLPCPCGQPAHYHELRTKPVLTAVGRVEVSRPYYWCPDCHAGQFPADVELDIENTEFSPGVRRMQALVGQEAPFDHGPGTDESSGGLGGDRQIGGAYGGGPRRRYRSARARGDPASPAVGPSPPCRGSRFPSCTCKWMGRECRW